MELLKELLKYAGFGSVTLFLGYLAKKILEPIFKKCLDFRLEKAKIHEKSIMDMQATVFSKKLEIESIKLNRALPSLEKINLLISNHRMMFNTYICACVNNSGFLKEREKERFDIDREIIEEIYKISIYLPEEMRIILNRIRRMISCSWKDPKVIFEAIRKSIFYNDEVSKRGCELYTKHHECFYEMVYKYCSMENRNMDYSKILEKYNISLEYDIRKEELLDAFINFYLLFPEYSTREEGDFIQKETFENN